MTNKKPFEDPEMSDYFSCLPPYVRETIVQSAGELKSLEELKSVACGLMDRN